MNLYVRRRHNAIATAEHNNHRGRQRKKRKKNARIKLRDSCELCALQHYLLRELPPHMLYAPVFAKLKCSLRAACTA